jgi:nifR3 family TIM-barrel protein
MLCTCRKLGAAMTRHEVVLDRFIVDGGGGPKSGEHRADDDRPIAAQLMGADASTMAAAGARMADMGYDVIDINFGCPVKKVLGKCRGGYLLNDPDTAIDIVRHVIDAVRLPVTLKMRCAHDDSSAAQEKFWTILEQAVALGVAGVAIHGRTVLQRYDGAARWDAIAEVKRRFPSLVVFGSGDLFSARDCLAMLKQTGCDGVTIARGAIANPWIFRECLALWRNEPAPGPPSVREQGELLDEQYRLAVAQYGPERASRQMRKFGIKRAALHPRAAELMNAFVALSSPADWHRLRATYYSPAAESA